MKSTTEKLVLLAEFEGWEILPWDGPESWFDSNDTLARGKSAKEFDYSTNWNSLMRVCKKWDTIDETNGIFLLNSETDKQYRDLCDKLDHKAILYDIEAVFNQLCECIEWLNSAKA